MNLSITAKDFPLTPSIRQYVAEHVAVLNHRAPVEMVRVELDVDHRHRHGIVGRCEVWVEVPGIVIAAGAKAESVRAAVDATMPKILRQLRDRKERFAGRTRGHHVSTRR